MHVLITGGNKGIGLEATKMFLNAGWQVTVVARNASQLNLNCTKHNIDLTDIAAIRKLPDLIGEVDVVINNAGIMHSADFREYDEDKKQTIIKLNLEAPIEIMTVFASTLKQKKWPHNQRRIYRRRNRTSRCLVWRHKSWTYERHKVIC